MPGPHDPNPTSSTGVVLRDAGEEMGNPTSAKEEGTVKGLRSVTRFWLVMAALLLGLATLAIGFIFFFFWPGVLAGESIGAGIALLALSGLLLIGARRATDNSAATLDRPAEPDPANPIAPPDVAPTAHTDTASAATLESPPAPAAVPAAEPVPESAAPSVEQAEVSAAAAPAPEAPAAPEPAPAPEAEPAPPRPAAPRTNGLAAQDGNAARASRTRPRPAAREDTALPRPPLSLLPHGYPRPSGGYSIDAEAEDLSQLLGDVAEQTVMAVATRGQRGVERRARMATKIDAFGQEMSVDPNFAPVVAFLEAISALLRAGKPIPASQALVDPFDGLYDAVLTVIRRKTGRTHD